ncbi:hypothetical protein GCM10010399_64920 [Dactylosporangium fulvum]|uniref:Tetratricopeptide repeat protein n=1 Tax=Dactylosporangium fulvum TaxID=53359 RepID=A0ABY5VPC6_9ACTN|nr:tetratricopeptide repeat protein [Dactylosporangium fulvum]UWP78891.1 tetratricopeptide repeat protein [Dactylosporangium fulvum]
MFGDIVRSHRRRLGLTQEELAAKANLSVRNIVKIEGGRITEPRPLTVRLLADALGLTGADRDGFLRSATGETTEPPPTGPSPVVVPAQLPPDVPAFIGREEQLAALDAMTAVAADQPTAVTVSVVSGTAGVGKTALAVTWAHRARGRFPDGQVFVNLRGYDPDRPMTAADALARLLAALGVAAQDVPADLDDRVAAYRTRLADRRVLVVLDNASSVEQVRPLLPGTASCAVLVTSRDSLAGLVAVDGARRIDLDPLSPADAHTLLRRLIGARVEADPGAATTLAEQCARLPLALRVAAQLAVSRPAEALGELVAELADQRQRLDLLVAGDDVRASVSAVFSWSLRHLPADAARTFRLLGLHPGPDLDPYAAACLTGADRRQAHRTLELLARAHLVHPTASGRYGMHDLLRAYAFGLTAGDSRQDTEAAQRRMFDHYLFTAAAAMDLLHPDEGRYRPEVPPPATPSPSLTDHDTARGWLDAERAVLIAVVAHTAAHGWPAHAVRLAAVLFRHLTIGHPADALAVHGHAADAARTTGDRAGEAEAVNGIGCALLGLGRYASAIEHLEQALLLFREIGDPLGQARALNNLGIIEERLGRHAPAAARFEESLRLFRQVGDRSGEARAMNNLGLAEGWLGRHRTAEEHHRTALALYRQLGNRAGEAHALTDLGLVEQRLGRPGPAAEHHRQALPYFLGAGDRTGEAWVRNGLGETALATGDPAGAVAQHTSALEAATGVGARDQQARAHLGLGDARLALDDRARAREHYGRSLALYTELGLPETDKVRARIDALE